MKPCNIVLILQMEKLRHTDTFPIQDHTGNLWQDQHRLLIAGVCLPQGSEGTTEHACSKDLWQRWSWGAPKWVVSTSFLLITKLQSENKYKGSETFLTFFFLFCLFVFNYLDGTFILPPHDSVLCKKKKCYTLLVPCIYTILNLKGLMRRRKAAERCSFRLMLSP